MYTNTRSCPPDSPKLDFRVQVSNSLALIRGYIELYRGYGMNLLTIGDVFLAFSAPGITISVKIPQTIRQIDDEFACKIVKKGIRGVNAN